MLCFHCCKAKATKPSYVTPFSDTQDKRVGTYDILEEAGLESYNLHDTDKELLGSLITRHQMFIVCDPKRDDCPIVSVSDRFCEFTGYYREEIMGRNCRFLQGRGTTPESVEKIRRALKTLKPTAVCLRNYKRDGTPFNNHFFISPLYNQSLKPVLFLGIQIALDVVTEKEEDMTSQEYLSTYGLRPRRSVVVVPQGSAPVCE
eukprot:c6572_g1_i1.p1 GENE.c6572_g1_i1~~c6572_g1_i1.p1  ORF type:complete len:203 (+),score=39.32 c6572_g1_i1:45-653(+)